MSEAISTERAAAIAARIEMADMLQALYRAHDTVREDPERIEQRSKLEHEIRSLLARGLS